MRPLLFLWIGWVAEPDLYSINYNPQFSSLDTHLWMLLKALTFIKHVSFSLQQQTLDELPDDFCHMHFLTALNKLHSNITLIAQAEWLKNDQLSKCGSLCTTRSHGQKIVIWHLSCLTHSLEFSLNKNGIDVAKDLVMIPPPPMHNSRFNVSQEFSMKGLDKTLETISIKNSCVSFVVASHNKHWFFTTGYPI